MIDMELSLALKSAKVTTEATFHGWRHFLNTQALASGMSRDKVQAITEHSSDSMTEHYAHLDVDHLQELIPIQDCLRPGRQS